MNDDLYAPPAARVADAVGDTPREFYVVAPRKFLLLYLSTLGLYSIYWFYSHWSLFKRFRRADLWPVPRSIFQVFFTHALFREIDARLRREKLRHDWNPQLLATAYVVLIIANRIADRLMKDETPWLFPLTIASIVLPALPLLYAQRAANRAVGDAEGSSNSALTAGNFAWMIAGGLVWLLLMASAYITIVGMPA